METVDLIIKAATEFYEELRQDRNGRYRSWEYCYSSFGEARTGTIDVDYLSLQLAFYLASWGMYRGSSFLLLQKDYRVHIPVVEELLKSEYDELYGLEYTKIYNPQIQELLFRLSNKLKSYYLDVRSSCVEREIKHGISDVLITKILMGTLGCVPAYDRYFIEGVKLKGVTTGIYNVRSLQKLADFYKANYDKLEAARSELKVGKNPYPQMKLLDMGFWKIGFDADTGKGLKVAH